jgi:hypothetical protein
MTCSTNIPVVTKHLRATSSTADSFEPFTDWMFCVGIDSVKRVLRNMQVSSGGTTFFRTKFAYQVASCRTDNPGSWTPAGSYVTGNAEASALLTSISTDTAAGFFVRFGVAYGLVSGSTPYEADVQLQIAFDACGEVVATRSFQTSWDQTTEVYTSITDWLPVIHVDKVKLVVIMTASTATYARWRWCYQTADTSPDLQSTISSWTVDTGTPSTYVTANETNTGDFALTSAPASTVFWIRFGIAFSSTTANTLAQATFSTAVAVRRS